MKTILLITVVSVVFLFILFGYVIFKKYLPRSVVIVDPNGRKRLLRPYKRFPTLLAALIPFKPISADVRVTFVQNGLPHDIPLRLKAIGHKKALLLNAVELYEEKGVYVQGQEKKIRQAIAHNNPTVTSTIHLKTSAVFMDGETVFRFIGRR